MKFIENGARRFAMIHIDRPVYERCWNPYDSFMEICVGCGCCSTDPLERAKSRLEVSERHLKHFLEFDNWDDDPEFRAEQEKNVKASIQNYRGFIRYYKRQVEELSVDQLRKD